MAVRCRHLLIAVAAAFAVGAVAAPAGHVAASLIADSAGAVPGKPFWVGLRMRHETGWHTYWKNPGDAGMPTRIDWILPTGWTAGGIAWPAPERIQIGQLASYGYQGDAVLPVKLFPPEGWNANTPVRIEAKANWLVCKEVCIPESGDFTLTLPAGGDAADRALLESWRTRVPQAFRFTSAGAERNGGRLLLTLAPAGAGQFFPEGEELVEPGDPPQLTLNGERVTWSAKLGVQGIALKTPATIAGVWVPKSGKPVYVEAKLK
jgi:DsbC/DsbD-like thiol-disulfide interchange protein